MASPFWPQPATSLWQSSGWTFQKAGDLALSLIWHFHRRAAAAPRSCELWIERDGPADPAGRDLGHVAGPVELVAAPA